VGGALQRRNADLNGFDGRSRIGFVLAEGSLLRIIKDFDVVDGEEFRAGPTISTR